MTKHYKYGSSTAERTVGCPAWANLAKLLPPPSSSEYADKGTLLHRCMEEIVMNAADDNLPFTDGIHEYLGDTYNDQVITQEDIDFKLIPACNALQEVIDKYGITEYEPELTLEHSELVGGTGDLICKAPKTAVVIDYKFGDGVQVYPEDNGQCMFIAALAAYDRRVADMFTHVTKIVCVIIQPNNREDETLRIWETTPQTVRLWFEAFKQAVEKAEAGAIEPNAGKWCKFCPAMATCPAKTGLAEQMKKMDVTSLQHEQVSEALLLAEAIEDWIKSVRTFAHEQMELGVKFPGFKLVATRATRNWNDEVEILDKIKKAKKLKIDKCTKTTVFSPAQLEKYCKANDIDFAPYEALYSKVSGGTTIAHEDDTRPELVPAAAIKAIADAVNK